MSELKHAEAIMIGPGLIRLDLLNDTVDDTTAERMSLILDTTNAMKLVVIIGEAIDKAMIAEARDSKKGKRK